MDAQGPLKTLQIGMTATAERVGGVDRYLFGLLGEIGAFGVETRGLVVAEPGSTLPFRCISAFAQERDGLLVRMRKIRGAATAAIGASDVVVSHFAPYTFALLDRLERKPLVVHFHGPWAGESAAEGAGRISVTAKRQLERIVYRRAARVIALSASFADIAVNDYGIPRERIRIVPGGVDVDRFRSSVTRAEARKRLGWPEDRPTIVTVRRLVRAKGLQNLIAAAARVRERVPDLFVAIVGTGPLAAELQHEIDAADLSQNVRMIGHAPESDLPFIYRAADLFVVPTITLEGFGLVVVEALAAGTPTLVTPIGGLPEVAGPLASGLVMDGYLPADLAAAIAGALSGERRMPSEDDCVSYAGRFRWHEIAGRIATIYREVA